MAVTTESKQHAAIFTLPNQLTVGRLVLAAVFFVLVAVGQMLPALGVFLLAFCSVLTLRSIIRGNLRRRNVDHTERQPDHTDTIPRKPHTHMHVGAARDESSAHGDLSELVGEDPDAAADILRTWISAGEGRP